MFNHALMGGLMRKVVDPGDYWEQVADFGGGVRRHPMGFSIDGIGYAGLGRPTTTSFATDLWAYDKDSDTWTQKANFTGSGVSGTLGASYNGKGYTGPGWTGTHNTQFYAYDPENNTWQQRTSFPGAGRNSPAVFVTADHLYVGTGQQYVGANVNHKDFYAYDDITNTWQQVADYPIGASNIQATSISGVGHCIGRDTHYAYDEIGNQWIAKSVLPNDGDNSRVRGLVTYNNRMFGVNFGGSVSEPNIYEYIELDNEWLLRETPIYPSSLRDFGCLSIDSDGIYVYGGRDGSYKKETYKYKPTP